MKGLKKVTAVALAAAMATSMTGCLDASWIVKGGDEKVSAGVYGSDILQSYMYGYMYMGTSYLDTEGVVEDMEASAKDYVLDVLGYNVMAKEMGVELTAEEKEEVAVAVDEMWESYGSLYEANRISKDAMIYANETSVLADKVFQAIYGEGGSKEIAYDEMYSIFSENYRKIGYLEFAKPTVTELSDDATAEEKAQVQATYDEALAEVQESVDHWMEQTKTLIEDQGLTFNDVIIAYDFENTSLTDLQETTVDTGDRYSWLDLRSESNPTELVEYLTAPEFNTAKLIETEDAFIIVYALDHEADPADFETMRLSLMYELKSEEMQADMDAYIEALNPEFNDAAISRYAPKNMTFGY